MAKTIGMNLNIIFIVAVLIAILAVANAQEPPPGGEVPPPPGGEVPPPPGGEAPPPPGGEAPPSDAEASPPGAEGPPPGAEAPPPGAAAPPSGNGTEPVSSPEESPAGAGFSLPISTTVVACSMLFSIFSFMKH